MRLFIAIDIPEEIKNYLRAVQEELPSEDAAVMRKTTDFHLTLKFLGSTDGNKKQEVEAALENIPFKQFTAELSGLGIFGSQNFPRVIWVGVKIPDWLFETQKAIEKKVTELGFEAENRFSPHLTLARVKFVKDPQKCREQMTSIKIEPKKFEVKKFCLFRSHLSPRGAVYERLVGFG